MKACATFNIILQVHLHNNESKFQKAFLCDAANHANATRAATALAKTIYGENTTITPVEHTRILNDHYNVN